MTKEEVAEFHRQETIQWLKKSHEGFGALLRASEISPVAKWDTDVEPHLIEGLRHSMCAWMLIEASRDQVLEMSRHMPEPMPPKP